MYRHSTLHMQTANEAPVQIWFGSLEVDLPTAVCLLHLRFLLGLCI